MSYSGSEDKSPEPSEAPPAASTHASRTIEVTDDKEEPVGDRWDDEEDWGSLEVD